MLYKELTPKRHFLLRLIKDESVLDAITEFCKKEQIHAGIFSAIGAVKNSTIGFYDLGSKQYGRKEYPDAMEVASMTGNIALVYPEGSRGGDGAPFIHCHCVLSGIAEGSQNQPIGGHVFSTTVAVTLEVSLVAYEGDISRTLDNDIGLKLLDL